MHLKLPWKDTCLLRTDSLGCKCVLTIFTGTLRNLWRGPPTSSAGHGNHYGTGIPEPVTLPLAGGERAGGEPQSINRLTNAKIPDKISLTNKLCVLKIKWFPIPASTFQWMQAYQRKDSRTSLAAATLGRMPTMT